MCVEEYTNRQRISDDVQKPGYLHVTTTCAFLTTDMKRTVWQLQQQTKTSHDMCKLMKRRRCSQNKNMKQTYLTYQLSWYNKS